MNLALIRTVMGDVATCGQLTVGELQLYTLELTYVDNLIDRSCVPTGSYELIPYDSPKHGPTWCLHNPALNIYAGPPFPDGGRAYCEIHSANWADQLLGCIAVGLDQQPMLDPMTGIVEPAVENSRNALSELVAVLGAMSKGHTLTISGAP